MSYKIAHCADTHIKNLKYHKEYREIFNEIFNRLKEEKPDYIVHCGDIAHTKTQISPEFVDMCAWFLGSLADIAPTYVILGNHDGNLRNNTRQDALSPIVKALNHKNLHLLKDSGEVVLQSDLALNVLSVFDEDNWKRPTDLNRINIALYHGSIGGVQTDIGYVMESGEHDINIFQDFDYAMLGDIHKTNQVLDTEGRVRYAGSTVQQNHGETNDKGFLIWNIESKDKFHVEHVAIENPTPFVTLELTKAGKIPKDFNVKEGSRLRVVGTGNLSLHQMRKAMDIAKKRFKPESLTYFNKASNGNLSSRATIAGMEYEDLRDLKVQEKLILEFLKDYEAEQEVLDKVLELNKKYNVLAEETEDSLRNVKWSAKKLSWNNLFNYGTNNSVNFDNLEGVVGIFGKNFSGKSSVIDSFLWVLQNSTSKNVRKNLNIINQNKSNGNGRLEIAVNNDMYVIERSAEKYVKKLKGEETEEAKTNLNFTKYNILENEELPEMAVGNENGTDRIETDKNIRKVFGTLDDFLFTSMTSQIGSLSFINEGSTKRKEILGKFLDLDILAKKFKMANEDASEIKGALKRLEGRDFDTEIEIAKQEVIENEASTLKHKKYCETIKSRLSAVEKEISETEKQIAANPDLKIWDIEKIKEQLSEATQKEEKINNQNKTIFEGLSEKRQLLQKANSLLAEIDVEDNKRKKEIVYEKEKELGNILYEIRQTEEKLERQKNKASLLTEVPCGDAFPTCKFLVDAHSAKKEIPSTENLVKLLNKSRVDVTSTIEELSPQKIDEVLQKYESLVSKKKDIEYSISQNQIEVERNKAKLLSLKTDIKQLNDQIEEYEKNKEIAILLKSLHKQKNKFLLQKKELDEELYECEQEMMELYKNHGSLEQKLQNLEELKGELGDLRIQYAAYDLYESCMHSNGISYDIIKKRLPIINEEIAKVLANVVNFEVFFEDDGKKLDILIKHPKYEPRPLELGSGAEKMLAAMAIRLSLIKISSLPQGDIFILDEPATALDEENMEGFIRIIDMLKPQFKTIILISHLDALKDIVDKQITIDNVDGFAQVNV